MGGKTVSVKLTKKDLYFITQSISLNIPCIDRDGTADEIATNEKMRKAYGRIVAKDNAND